MGYTKEQLRKINDAKKKAYIKNFANLKKEVKSIVDQIKLPATGGAAPEYKELMDEINTVVNSIKTTVAPNVIKEFEQKETAKKNINGVVSELTKDDEKLSDVFSLGNLEVKIDAHTLATKEQDFDPNKSVDGEIQYIDENAPVVPEVIVENTLRSIKHKYDVLMAENGGDKILSPFMQAAGEAISKLEDARNMYVSSQYMAKSEEYKIELAVVKTMIDDHEKALVKHINGYDKKIGCTQLAREIEKNKKIIEEKQKELDELMGNKAAELTYNKDVVKKTNENIELENKAKELAKDKDIVVGMLDDVAKMERESLAVGTEFSSSASVKEKIAKERLEIQKLIKDTQNRIEENNKKAEKAIKDREKLDKELGKHKGFVEKNKEIERNHQELNICMQYAGVTNDVVVMTRAQNVLTDLCKQKGDKVTREDVEKYFDNSIQLFKGTKAKEGKGSPIYYETQAKSAIIKLMVDCDQSPQDIIANFDKAIKVRDVKKASQNYFADRLKIINEQKGRIFDLLQAKDGKFSLQEYRDKCEALAQDKENAEKAKASLKELLAKYEQQLAKNDMELKEWEEKANKRDIPAWVKNAYDSLDKKLSDKTLANNKKAKELLDNFKKVNRTIKSKKGKLTQKDYNTVFASLSGYITQVQQVLTERENELKVEINNGDKKIKENVQAILAKKDEITKSYDAGLTKLNIEIGTYVRDNRNYEVLLTEQNRLLERQKALYNELNTHVVNATSLVSAVENGLAAQILDTAIGKYRNLNDSRKQWYDSKEYIEMITPLCSLVGLNPPSYNEPNIKAARVNMDNACKKLPEIYEKMQKMKIAAQKYIEAKEKQNRKNPSKQRIQRLNMAKQLITMADNTCKEIKVTHSFTNKELKAFKDAYLEKSQALITVSDAISANGDGKEGFARMLDSVKTMVQEQRLDKKDVMLDMKAVLVK